MSRPGKKPKADESDGSLKDGAIAAGGGAVAVGKDGIYISGDVGGDILGAGAVKAVFTGEEAYQVYGLPNPYMGLRSYTYEDRSAYSGREADIRQAVEQLTNPASPLDLLFVTGTSGCGKSSFVQAGLLPALEAYYVKRHKNVRQAVFRPSSSPIAMLADGLSQLALLPPPASELATYTPDQFNQLLAKSAFADRVNLLVVDQFEECFTQSAPEQRDHLFRILTGLSAFADTHLHVIVTVRSDYLDELFQRPALWQAARQGVELRAMTVTELKEAIQGPLQAAASRDERYRLKRFEPALLDRLAGDAALEPAYLPLLQVTLQELWNGGSLVLERYGQLTEAIRQRAEVVFGYDDYDSAFPAQPRPQEHRQAILDIFLDLISVSLDDDPRRDVRRRREKAELVGGAQLRGRLVESLTAARLLSAGTEMRGDTRVEVVDIIHESLVSHWIRLREAVAGKRQDLQRRVRFELALGEWDANLYRDDYLLSGVRLAEAGELAKAGDISLRDAAAQHFLRASREKAEADQQRQLNLERQSRRRLQILVAVLAALLLLAGVYFAYPFVLSRLARGPMAYFPAGKVVLGTNIPLPEESEEGPQITLLIPEFWLERYEVSNYQYRLCVRAQRCIEPFYLRDFNDPAHDDWPVVGVTALQAFKYCRWIGRQLPDEAQWEQAARGQDGLDWPWGDAPLAPERANLDFAESGELIPMAAVAGYAAGASPEGVHHLIGNAAEWTATYPQFYEAYDLHEVWNGDPAGLSDDTYLITRGASRESIVAGVRSTVRDFFPALSFYPSIGFRCSQTR